MTQLGFPSPFRRTGKRLFIKIFWVFWLAMSVAGVVLLAIEAERAGRLQKLSNEVNGAAIAFYAVSVAKDHEDEQAWESRAFLKDLKARTGIEAWLFDAQGNEVSGHDKAELRVLERETNAIPQLSANAQSAGKTVFEPLHSNTLAAHAVIAPSGKLYTFVGLLPRSRFGPWNALPRVQLMRLLAVLITAGVVSWILALHLTRPISTLRQATHRLAEGDLSARAAPAAEYQRDELGELSRDFNRMADRLENSIQEQNRLIEAQKRLLGNVAHELRSPLARISVALELARDADSDASEDADQHESMVASGAVVSSIASSHDRIELEVGRLNDLIARLLTLSKLESGVQKRNDVPIDLNLLVETVIGDADYEARPAKRVVFAPSKKEDDETAYIIPGTPDLLRSAVENVVRNAIRHTAKNTAVEVRLYQERNDSLTAQRWGLDTENCFLSPPSATLYHPSFLWAVISVRDHGTGVPTDELREVFQPFYRAGKGRTMRDGGVGLGLAITLGAVELHEGQIRACNVQDGGLLVEIRLPLSEINSFPK